jgi:branched-chain amino acid transport system substrate-binding protein
MKCYPGRLLPLTALTVLAVAACGTQTASTTSAGLSPITVGVDEPLTGSFNTDGIASLRGYQLWASDVNGVGGLLGRQVKLVVVNDNSNPATVTKNYTRLVTQDHVDFTLAPFSSLLSVPAAQITEKYHYALPAGTAGAPSVMALNDPDLFSTNTPVTFQMVPFANWVLSLPPSERPKTAAYPMVYDPFADPPVQKAEQILQAGGVTTAYSHPPVTPNATDSNLIPIADAVAAKNPQIVVLGTVDVPSLLQFIHAFKAAHFTPKIMIASSGPDQGQAFLSQLGPLNAEAIMVPDGWYGEEQNALSHVMVQDYIAKYGGTTSDINADVAEAYSAGEILADGITGTGGLSNAGMIAYLHRHTFQTVLGPANFTANGTNPLSPAFIFQWQNGQFLQVLPTHPIGSPPIELTKPAWQGN